MTKELFLKILRDRLSDFPEGKLSDILYDYKEHFDVGFSLGKSEGEIIEELGDPNDIVAQYRDGYLKEYEVENKEYTNSNSDSNTSYENNNNTTNNNNTNNNLTIILTITILIMKPELIIVNIINITVSL